jgi:putative copper export protein
VSDRIVETPGSVVTALLVILLILTPGSLAYALFYGFRPWRRTQQGRALMVKAISNALLLSMALAFMLFGDYPGREVIRLVGLCLLTVGTYYLLASLLFSPGARQYPPWSWFRRTRNR